MICGGQSTPSQVCIEWNSHTIVEGRSGARGFFTDYYQGGFATNLPLPKEKKIGRIRR